MLTIIMSHDPECAVNSYTFEKLILPSLNLQSNPSPHIR